MLGKALVSGLPALLAPQWFHREQTLVCASTAGSLPLQRAQNKTRAISFLCLSAHTLPLPLQLQVSPECAASVILPSVPSTPCVPQPLAEQLLCPWGEITADHVQRSLWQRSSTRRARDVFLSSQALLPAPR